MRQTRIANIMDTIDQSRELDMKLDECCKKILANKMILAWILKGCLEEYKDCTISEIAEELIEGEPEIGRAAVHMDEATPKPEDISKMNCEEISLKEGKVTYDIRFHTYAPKSEKYVKIIVNVEAQNKYSPGYPLPKRGIYYCGRMISAQYGTEFTASHYENLKKVASIWICLTPPEYKKHTINRYLIKEEQLVGNTHEKPENYELMELIVICIGNYSEDDETKGGVVEEMLKMLEIVFESMVETETKKSKLEQKYGIPMEQEMSEEVEKMCNYSEGIRQKGIEQGIELGIERGIECGIERGITKVIKNMLESGMPVEEIVKVSGITKEEVEAIAESRQDA